MGGDDVTNGRRDFFGGEKRQSTGYLLDGNTRNREAGKITVGRKKKEN